MNNALRYLITNSMPILLFILLAASSCSRKDIFHNFNTIPTSGWNKNDIKLFTPSIDTLSGPCNIYLHIEYDNKYTYRNLYLFITCTDQNRHVIFDDTLNCMLADEYGKWLGSGFGDLYSQSFEFKSKYSFPKKGDYNIFVEQGMRDDVIYGIDKVGIEISLSKDR